MDGCAAPLETEKPRLRIIIGHACHHHDGMELSSGEDEFTPRGPVISGPANAPFHPKKDSNGALKSP
jgi:hypothetical protein